MKYGYDVALGGAVLFWLALLVVPILFIARMLRQLTERSGTDIVKRRYAKEKITKKDFGEIQRIDRGDK